MKRIILSIACVVAASHGIAQTEHPLRKPRHKNQRPGATGETTATSTTVPNP